MFPEHKLNTSFTALCVSLSHCAVLLMIDSRACSSVRVDEMLAGFRSVPFGGLLSGFGCGISGLRSSPSCRAGRQKVSQGQTLLEKTKLPMAPSQTTHYKVWNTTIHHEQLVSVYEVQNSHNPPPSHILHLSQTLDFLYMN